MKSANPFSDYDLLPYGEKKAQNGITIPKPDNRPQAKVDVSKSINLNLRPSHYHEVLHEMLNRQENREKPINWGHVATGALAAFDTIIPDDKIEEPVVYPLEAYNQGQYGRGSQAIAKNGAKLFSGVYPNMDFGGIIPGLSGTMYSRNAYKVKNKITNPMLMPYGGTIGGEDPVTKPKPAIARTIIPGQTVVKNEQQMLDINNWIGNFELQRGGPGNAVGVRKVGDAIPKFVGDVPPEPVKKAMKIPAGAAVELTNEGYMYLDDSSGRWIPVDSQALFSAKKTQTKAPDAIAKLEYGGEIAKDGHWIQKAVNPKHKGYCTPMTKKTCTPRRKALARTFKKHHGFHKKDNGGMIPYFEEGASYDLSDDQIRDLISQGYEIEM